MSLSNWLQTRPFLQLVTTGICISLISGLIIGAVYQLAWFLVFIPVLAMFLIECIGLLVPNFRRILSGRKCLAVLLSVNASAIVASVLFIVIGLIGILPGLDTTYLYWERQSGLNELTHPIDSIIDIWGPVIIYLIALIPIVLTYSLARLFCYIYNCFAKIRHQNIDNKLTNG